MAAPKLTPGQKGAGAVGIIAAILAGLYVREGGYVDHPDDRGGKTRYGITEAVAREWGYNGHMRDFPKRCDARTPVCSDLIYTTSYIDRPGYRPFAAIEPALLDELVDSAVLHGPPLPSGWLQGSLNAVCGAALTVDRKVGARTVAAYQVCQQRYGRVTACIRVLDQMDKAQLAYFDAIVLRRPSQKVFYRGWTTHRIGNVDRRKCGSGVA